MIIQANYLYENGKEHEAIGVLNKILLEYSPHDPYTLTFLANIYYSMSVDIRSKNIDKERIKKAIELYFRALEYDKYNALAAVGLSNCLCEFNYVDKAIDIYRSIMEKFPNEYNAIINSSLIYMDDKKYEKASILLRKVLVNIFHGNNAKIENLLAKCCIEMKEFKSANQYIKNLIMKYPDNSIYQYNYGFLLYSQFDDIINKTTRKCKDTEKAIKIISRALKIFEELNKNKKDEKYDKIIQKSEFLYKCGEMKNICSVNLNKAKELLNEDLQNEEKLKKKNEDIMLEYKKLLEDQKVQKEEEEKKKMKEVTEQDEEIKKENLELMNLIEQKKEELLMKQKNKEKKEKKKGKKKGKKKEDEGLEEEYEESVSKNIQLNEENEEKEYEEKESEEDKGVNSDYVDEEEENRKRRRREEKKKKKLTLRKRKLINDEDENEKDNESKSKDKDENNDEDKKENENENNNEDDNNKDNNSEKEKENEDEDNGSKKEENHEEDDNNEKNAEENEQKDDKMDVEEEDKVKKNKTILDDE